MNKAARQETYTEHDKKIAIQKAIFDIMDGVTFAQILINRNVWEISGTDKSHDWRAYSIAAVISYSRPFKRSYGLPEISDFLTIDDDLHQKMIRRRDAIIAHGDVQYFSIHQHDPRSGLTLSSNLMYLSEKEASDLVRLGLSVVSILQNLLAPSNDTAE